MSDTLTIRKLDEALKARLRLQAAQHGQSMEQEARDILRRALQPPAEGGLAQRIRARFAGLGADDLPIPARQPARLPDMSGAPADPAPDAQASAASPDLAGPALATGRTRRRRQP